MNFQGQPLFITPPELEKIGSKLSKDTSSWEGEVMDTLHSEHPYLLDYPINIKIRKSDEESGHGIGAIKIAELVSIPIIIESNQLQPLDVFMNKEGQVQTMSRLTLEEALQSKDIGKPIKPSAYGGTSDSAMGHQVLPPYDGKYAFASAIEVSTQDLADLFSDTTAQHYLSMNSACQAVMQELSASKFEKVASTRGAEIMADEEVSAITASGMYKVATDAGMVPGVVPDRTVSLTTGETIPGLNAFIGMGKYASTTGQVLGSIAEVEMALTSEIGRGVYVLGKEGELVASEPFQVMRSPLDKEGLYIRTDLGDTRRIEKVAGLEEDIISAGNVVYLSEDWKFLPAQDTVKLAEATTVGRDGDILDMVRIGDRIRVSDPSLVGLDKLAANEGIPAEEAVNAMTTAFGADLAETVIVKLAEDSSARVLVEKDATPVNTFTGPIPTLSDEEHEALAKVAAMITPELCKEAKVNTEYADKTIDAVLGLNFMSPENLHRFIDMLPALEEAQQVIAKLLLASRLGLAIESRPLRTTMYSLDAVIRDLKELRNQTMVR